MSTYLVAFVVGEFDYVEDKTSDGVAVRVYTPLGKREQGLFALEVATKVLPYYNEYFKISYPLPKMDLIAIPDFSAGAMENWGLVTYRESCLLVDPEHTSTISKQWISLMCGHEIAHQWFGNLVTMKWWTHLWLNEGYASFIEYMCVEYLFPEFDIWTQFLTDAFTKALELDALKNSHPVEVPINNPEEIDEIFDDISYSKGSSIIRMLHSWIGNDDFRAGMTLYLKTYSYANAETEDLWNALEATSKKPVSKVMSTWTKQIGFPVLKVDQRQQGNDRVLSISQRRFIADGSSDDENNLWMIPISMSTSVDSKFVAMSTVMSEKETNVTIPNVTADTWIKVNPGTIGFFRVHYSTEMLNALVPSIKDRSLPPVDRFGILDDLFSITKAGQVSTVEVLKLLRAYQHENDYTVWSNICSCLYKIDNLLSHLDIHEKFQQFSRDLLKDVSKKMGWEPKQGESHLDTLLRSLVLGKMAVLRDEDTVAEAKRRFDLHIAGATKLRADLRSTVYRAVLGSADEATFESMIAYHRSTDMHEEKNRILSALGAVRDEALLKRALNFAISDDVRAQDTLQVLPLATLSYQSRLISWQFVRDNWTVLTQRCLSGILLPRLICYVTENFVTDDKVKEMEQYFAEHSSPGNERTVQQCIEKIRLNAAWLSRDKDDIERFLREQV